MMEHQQTRVRIHHMTEEAKRIFGSSAKAATWLRRSTAALKGKAPLDLLESDEGAQHVATLLGRIAHGIVGP